MEKGSQMTGINDFLLCLCLDVPLPAYCDFLKGRSSLVPFRPHSLHRVWHIFIASQNFDEQMDKEMNEETHFSFKKYF